MKRLEGELRSFYEGYNNQIDPNGKGWNNKIKAKTLLVFYMYYNPEIRKGIEKQLKEDQTDYSEDDIIERISTIYIVDGPRDLGIDAFFLDNSTLYLIQGKYRSYRAKGPLELNEELIKEDISKVMKTLEDEKRFNRLVNRINNQVGKTIDIEKIDQIEYIYVTNTKIPGHIDDKVLERWMGSIKNVPDITCSVVDVTKWDELLNKLEDRLLVEGNFTFRIPTETYAVHEISLEGIGKVEIGLTLLRGSDIKRLYERFKDGLFRSNPRNPLKKSKVNRAIKATLRQEPTKFPLLNNGITIVAKKTEWSRKSVKIQGFGVVNGAQTIESISKANPEAVGEESLSNVLVPAKIITLMDISDVELRELIAKIGQSSNRQNKIEEADLFSFEVYHVWLHNLARRSKTIIDKETIYSFKRPYITSKRADIVMRADHLTKALNYFYASAYSGVDTRKTHNNQELFGEEYKEILRKVFRADDLRIANTYLSSVNYLERHLEFLRSLLLYYVQAHMIYKASEKMQKTLISSTGNVRFFQGTRWLIMYFIGRFLQQEIGGLPVPVSYNALERFISTLEADLEKAIPGMAKMYREQMSSSPESGRSSRLINMLERNNLKGKDILAIKKLIEQKGWKNEAALVASLLREIQTIVQDNIDSFKPLRPPLEVFG
ncbi:AIPR family protein [Thermococcus sp. 21S7]|uniref:AIPR family protein n=1 Tax=Thermococcus sp. 21S7 TaxID=1638221 RepID=UPI00143AD053|nr:AIPR family protein [Thermococcus sp. 21S7]